MDKAPPTPPPTAPEAEAPASPTQPSTNNPSRASPPEAGLARVPGSGVSVRSRVPSAGRGTLAAKSQDKDPPTPPPTAPEAEAPASPQPSSDDPSRASPPEAGLARVPGSGVSVRSRVSSAGRGSLASSRRTVLPSRDQLVTTKKFTAIRGSLLRDAAMGGDDAAVAKLIESGIPIECKDVRLCRPPPAKDAALRAYLSHLPHCTVQAHGSSALLLAAKNNRVSTVKLLLDQKADVNTRTKLNATPLIAASSHGHADVVKVLLAAGADRTISVTSFHQTHAHKRTSTSHMAGTDILLTHTII